MKLYTFQECQSKIEDKLTIEEANSKESFENFDAIMVTNYQSRIPIERFTRVHSIIIHGGQIDWLNKAQCINELYSIIVENTTLSSLAFLAPCHELTHLDLPANKIRDLGPIMDKPELEELDVRANPLSEESYDVHIPQLLKRGVKVLYDSDEVWRINRRLDETGYDLAYIFDPPDKFKLAALRRDIVPEPVLMTIPVGPQELTTRLDRERIDFSHMYNEYAANAKAMIVTREAQVPPAAPAFDRGAHIEVGDADQTREWITAGNLAPALKKALLRFVSEFPSLRFVREDDQYLDNEERESETPIPSWLRQVRKTCGRFLVDKSPATVYFSSFLSDSNSKDVGEYSYFIDALGPWSRDLRERMVMRYGLYPIGWGGVSDAYLIAIKANSSKASTSTIYRVDHLALSMKPARIDDYPIFRNWADMIDHIVAVSAGNTRIERIQKSKRSH